MLQALTSLASKLNPTSLLSDTAEKLCDAVLPKELEFIGDLVGLSINLKTGNYLKAMDDLQDLFRDLPEQLAELKKRTDGSASLLGDALMEPSLPPPRKNPGPMGAVLSAAIGLTPDPAATPAPIASAASSPKTRGAPASASSKEAPPVRSETEPSPRAPASAAQTTKGEKSASTAQTTKSEKSTATAQTTKSEKSSASKKSDSKAVEAFFKLSDADLMNKVRNGGIPEEVSRDPSQMHRLQARMNEIAQMNQIITSMLAAMHQMNMAIIQNVRV